MASPCLGRRVSPRGGTCSQRSRSETADAECMGDEWEPLVVPLRLRDTGGTHVGPGRAELAPAISSKAPGGIWLSSCPAWCTVAPHHSHPTAGLGTVGCTPPGWGDGRVVVRPRMVAAVTATTTSLHGVGAQRWVQTTALQRRGGAEDSPWPWAPHLGGHLWPPHPAGQPWPWVPCPAGRVATAELPLGTWSREAKRCAMRLRSLTNAGTESSVFIGVAPNCCTRNKLTPLHRQTHAPLAAGCPGSSPSIPAAERGCTKPLGQRRCAARQALPVPVLPVRPRLRPSQHPQRPPARVCAGTRIPRRCGQRTRRGPSLRGKQHSPNVCSAVTTEMSLSSHPAVNRTFPFLLLLYVAVIPLN